MPPGAGGSQLSAGLQHPTADTQVLQLASLEQLPVYEAVMRGRLSVQPVFAPVPTLLTFTKKKKKKFQD